MVTGEIKNKIVAVDCCDFEGNANPLTNIEQLTYLLFI